ncbi:PA0069 family radical SAM protein [Rubinisphaera margarita]|uniref:PA0069 family radical SAM protein n=1 Tax=Rubinisphaera margarita TaxID=2909586 RepID=UPI001EE8625F|nr:PA0069 family radical SAM protein [Rubinisphaera margarita]MCG6156640.1 PA0069 family radical SAM protein [Rubinisphaera margarita]
MRHGSHLDPPNRFERVHVEPDFEHLEWDVEYLKERADRKIQYLADSSRSIVSENDSPDVPFRFSLNPYRGCAHACPYCYARNSHEYLGLNAGLDFETRIFVKHEAPKLLRDFLSRDRWVPEPIIFSGVTDCYQPAERKFRLTRQCLEVASDCHQPVSIITKNALVLRDLDLLRDMAARRLVHVNLSITSLDVELARVMEPRTSIPAARLRAVESLANAGVPVRVMVAPLIPGLNDHEAAGILKAARDAGAVDARYVLLRLPLTVEPVFREWLERTQPLKAEKVESLVRQTRSGKLNESNWGERMVGSGEIANQIRTMFQVFRQKYGFSNLPELDVTQFVPPQPSSGQLRLF